MVETKSGCGEGANLVKQLFVLFYREQTEYPGYRRSLQVGSGFDDGHSHGFIPIMRVSSVQ